MRGIVFHRRGFGGIGQQVPEDGAFIATLGAVCANAESCGGKGRLLIVEDEVVEVHVAPAGFGLVDDADEDAFASDGFQIHGNALHVFLLSGAAAVDDLAGGFFDDFDAFGVRIGGCADEEAGPGVGGDEAGGGEGTGAFVASALITAEPEFAGVLGVAAFAGGDGVAFDGLFFPGIAFGFPACEGAGFEAEVELGRRWDGGDVGSDGTAGRSACITAFWHGSFAEVGELDVAELDFRRTGAAVELEGDLAAPFSGLGLVVVEHAHEDVIHADFDVGGCGGDLVFVPVAGFDDADQALVVCEDIGPAAAIGCNAHA